MIQKNKVGRTVGVPAPPGGEIRPAPAGSDDLQQWAEEDLARSGLSWGELEAIGARLVPDEVAFRATVGFVPECGENPVEGYAFPYLNPQTGAPTTGDNGMPFWRVRLRFPATKPDGAKYLTPSKAGVRAFILPEVAEALEMQEAPLYLVEGEKKAMTMTKYGFSAIGIPGVTCWCVPQTRELLPSIAEYLHDGRAVIFVEDSDMMENPLAKPNVKRLATACSKYGAVVKTLILPSTGDAKVGADDFLVAHGGEPFREVLGTAEIVRPDGRVTSGYVNGRKLDAATAAAEVAKAFAGDEVGDAPKLAFWRGGWYRRADEGDFSPVTEGAVEADVTAELLKISPTSVSKGTIASVLQILRSRAYFFLDETWEPPFFFSDGTPLPSTYLALQNGYINAAAPEEGIVCPHARVFGVRKLPVTYDPEAECPNFIHYLESSLPDLEARYHVQLMLGLCLVPDTTYNVMFFLYDPEGGSGRSLLLQVIRRLVGPENTVLLHLDQLNGDFVGEELTSALVNLIDDMPERFVNYRPVAVDFLKSVTSGAPIRINRKHQQETENRVVTARIIAATNYLPAFTESDDALYDRVRIIPFHVRFRGTDQQDPRLDEKLMAEQAGIFNFALEGLWALREMKTFPMLPEGADLIAQHREETDSVRNFCRSCLEKDDNDNFVSSNELWREYLSFCDETNGGFGVKRGVFLRRIRKNLPAASPAMGCRGKRLRGYRGVRILSPAERRRREEAETEE